MIDLIYGDITSIRADAIVNAANSIMLGGGGVDGAIHRAAGPELAEACRKYKSIDGIRCSAGEARITEGFKLPASFVIHTVGPRYLYDKNPAELLRSSYRSSLQLAMDNNLTRIVFPAISCGAYAYPVKKAAKIALSECSKDKYSDLEIIFCLFSQADLQVFQEVMKSLTD